jgi:hypothetical protein
LGGEIILLNCCKWLQINRTFFRFKEQMLELMEGKLGESHSGELHRETAEQRANLFIAEELARRGWPESELATRRRSDPGKLASAARLRSQTTLPINWIAG